jgi:hypothetical protein
LGANVTVEHILSPKNAMPTMGIDPGTSCLVSHHSTNWAKGISINSVSIVGYEPTTVPLSLGKGAFPLQ